MPLVEIPDTLVGCTSGFLKILNFFASTWSINRNLFSEYVNIWNALDTHEILELYQTTHADNIAEIRRAPKNIIIKFILMLIL